MLQVTNPYEDLANAIIRQAAEDWRTAAHVLQIRPEDECSLRKLREIEAFFHSQWYGTLTAVDAEYLLVQLRKEAGIK